MIMVMVMTIGSAHELPSLSGQTVGLPDGPIIAHRLIVAPALQKAAALLPARAGRLLPIARVLSLLGFRRLSLSLCFYIKK
jgi:hypothetical protein